MVFCVPLLYFGFYIYLICYVYVNYVERFYFLVYFIVSSDSNFFFELIFSIIFLFKSFGLNCSTSKKKHLTVGEYGFRIRVMSTLRQYPNWKMSILFRLLFCFKWNVFRLKKYCCACFLFVFLTVFIHLFMVFVFYYVLLGYSFHAFYFILF